MNEIEILLIAFVQCRLTAVIHEHVAIVWHVSRAQILIAVDDRMTNASIWTVAMQRSFVFILRVLI